MNRNGRPVKISITPPMPGCAPKAAVSKATYRGMNSNGTVLCGKPLTSQTGNQGDMSPQ